MSTSKANSTPKEVYIGTEETYLKKLDLIEIQKNSWQKFLDHDVQSIIEEFFPIEDYTGKKFSLYFEGIYYGKPRFPFELCLQKKTHIRLTCLRQTKFMSSFLNCI